MTFCLLSRTKKSTCTSKKFARKQGLRKLLKSNKQKKAKSQYCFGKVEICYRAYRQAFILYKHGEAWISDKSNNADFWSQERKCIFKICCFDTNGICNAIR